MMKYSQTEVQHLTISWLAISLAFAIAKTGVDDVALFLTTIVFSAITVGIGFVAHELAHKYLAQKYDAFAEYRADFKMLLIAVLISFTGFIFAAPGAVHIAGHISKDKYGRISLAGPLMNYIIAIVFASVYFATGGFSGTEPGGFINAIAGYGFSINAFLGLFNLLPFGQFDGHKILAWNKPAYYSMLVIGFVLVGVSSVL